MRLRLHFPILDLATRPHLLDIENRRCWRSIYEAAVGATITITTTTSTVSKLTSKCAILQYYNLPQLAQVLAPNTCRKSHLNNGNLGTLHAVHTNTTQTQADVCPFVSHFGYELSQHQNITKIFRRLH